MKQVEELVLAISRIDKLLRQCNCVLMFAQPKQPGKITLLFPKAAEENDTESGNLGIPPIPRVIQWHLRVANGEWYFVTLPSTNLRQRAKGKGAFGTGYYQTADSLDRIGKLLASRKRGVEALRSLKRRVEYFQKEHLAQMEEFERGTARSYVEHSHIRHSRGPTQEEWAWFESGGAKEFPRVKSYDED